MTRYINTLALMVLALLVAASCSSENNLETNDKTTEKEIVAKANEEGEAYLNALDYNDSLNTGNSLYYSRKVDDKMEWTEVIMSIDDSSNILKMVEKYLTSGSDAVFSNHFYFKNGQKYATKQFFEERIADSAYFVELLSYYDKDEKVSATKRRTAIYEDFLPQEQFMVSEKIDCSADRAFSIINQTGEFETTYQGFVDMGGFKYLVVGEDDPDGFSSALIVQRLTPLIMELRSKESEMIGTPLVVNFQTVTDGTGSQQILLAVGKKK